MKTKRFIELDLNLDSPEGVEIYAVKKIEATGRDLIAIINKNPGLMWLTPQKADLKTIKVCCEEIIERGERNTLPFKLAKAILKLIKQPRTRNVAEGKPKRPRRR